MYSYIPDNQDDAESFLFTTHEGLPRQGPGSMVCTKKMFSFLPLLPELPEILNLGCRAGHTCVTNFPLPASAWRADYYSPLLNRLPALEHQYTGDAEAEVIISLTRQDIELFEKYSGEWVRVLPLKNKE